MFYFERKFYTAELGKMIQSFLSDVIELSIDELKLNNKLN